MGLLSGLLLLPLAPVRGIGWVADRIAEAAEEEVRDPAPLMARLGDLHRALDAGEIGLADFEEEEERLLLLLRERETGTPEGLR
ncbi:gas vesicle protein GvpG [Streptomyces sp. NBC_01803]|uniref:gas vesicle protein GvpG n=1 Tax=Streptomyces sp. NBC_01803 TaxID=2975946 RepID=UPI002DDB7292|nr:gas vesicle protein GvpG [Streptomyces sp. NBC_01803]WSA44167.1 gas vesicle protein GvpG [Streptomyces sp. NBC_01803]